MGSAQWGPIVRIHRKRGRGGLNAEQAEKLDKAVNLFINLLLILPITLAALTVALFSIISFLIS